MDPTMLAIIPVTKEPRADFSLSVVSNINVKIIFVGDSITDFYDYATYFPDRAADIINYGAAGDTTTIIYDRRATYIAEHAQKAFIMAGINDFRLTADDAATVYARYVSIIEALIADSAIIYIQSTLHTDYTLDSGSDATTNGKVDSLNSSLLSYAAANGHTYIDMVTTFNPTTNTIDGVHPNASGYDLMTNILNPYLAD